MLLAALFAVPLWLTLPLYFAIGITWAVLYLPRAVSLQARRYREWRNERTNGKSVAETLSASAQAGDYRNFAAGMLREHGSRPEFTERQIIKGFMLDIAFWPVRFLIFVVVDGLQLLFEKLDKLFSYLWTHVFVPFCDWVGRQLRTLCRSIYRALRGVWTHVIAPAYRWVYQHVARTYQAVIQRANREAIADMEVLNRIQDEKK